MVLLNRSRSKIRDEMGIDETGQDHTVTISHNVCAITLTFYLLKQQEA